MKLASLSPLVVVLLLPSSAALGDTFELKPGPLNRVVFENDAPLETITGMTSDVSGTIEIDLAKPAGAKGKVTIPVKSIDTGVAKRNEDLQSDQWFDAAKHPDMTFAIEKVEIPGALEDGKVQTAKVHGQMTIKGRTKPVVAAAKVSFHKVTEKQKAAWIMADAVRVKALFQLRLSDFGIKIPDNLAGVKVADEVEIKASLTALRK